MTILKKDDIVYETPFIIRNETSEGLYHKAWCRLCGHGKHQIECSHCVIPGEPFWESERHYCVRGHITLIIWSVDPEARRRENLSTGQLHSLRAGPHGDKA